MAVRDALSLAKQVLRSGAAQVVGSLGVLVASGVTGSLNVVLGYAGADPLSFALWSALAFLLGAFAWQVVDEVRMRPSKRRKLLKMRLSGLSEKELGIVRDIVCASGEFYLKVDDPSVDKLAKTGAIRIHDGVYEPPDKWPFTLDDSLRALVVEFPDALTEALSGARKARGRLSEPE